MSRAALPLILLAVATIYGLYRLSYAFEHSQHELAHYNRQILATRQEISVLHAEWAYLSRPAEIARLSAQYMADLKPVSVQQIVTIDAIRGLPARLPPPPVPLAAPSVAAKPLTAGFSGSAGSAQTARDAKASAGRAATPGLRLAERILGANAEPLSLGPAHGASMGGTR